jgi:hypothetical protein
MAKHVHAAGAVERAATALSKRGHKTGVSRTDYILHLQRPSSEKTWCGRLASKVNAYLSDYVSPYAPEEEEQTCRACVKARNRAGKIAAEKA